MINLQALALVEMIQHELNLQAAGEYERLQIMEPHQYYTLPVKKEPSFVAFDGECLPIKSSFEVDHVDMQQKKLFYREPFSDIHDAMMVCGMLIGISHKCKTVIYYLNEPYLWDLVLK